MFGGKQGLIIAFMILYVMVDVVQLADAEVSEINGYHFHTYFFQENENDKAKALAFRDQLINLITNGTLAECAVNRVNYGPRGPHPIGSYETCCNKTSLNSAMSWFMKNRGTLSVLLHPLTRYEVRDHTDRAMWLGKSMPLDISALSDDLGQEPTCPIRQRKSNETKRRKLKSASQSGECFD